jgi:hypothetical protein
VYEYIFAGLALDEAEALARVKPLHSSLFFHGISSWIVELFGASRQFCNPLDANEKRLQERSLQPFEPRSKGFTRAANAPKA